MKRVDVLRRKRVFDDVFKIDEAEVQFELRNGQMSPVVRRLSFERGDSIAAVVWRRDTDALLFTEQFRFPTVEKGPGWLLEIMAGMVDPGETADTALRREIEEELGYRVQQVTPIATFYPSPGGSSERISLFFVEAAATEQVSDGGGLAAEHEDIRIVTMPRSEARQALDQHRFMDAKTIIGLQWFFERGPGR
jgi:nudix-type nucleoside diphosphatase (YffH/AdpP family)